MVAIDSQTITDLLGSDIIAALLGAAVGAVGASWVTRRSIRFERETAARDAVLALADEAKYNATVLRHRKVHLWGFSASTLERQAFDAALPALHVLPPDLRERAREVRGNVLQFNFIEAMLAESLSQRDSPAPSMKEARTTLFATLPDELDDLAARITAFSRDSRFRWWR